MAAQKTEAEKLEAVQLAEQKKIDEAREAAELENAKRAEEAAAKPLDISPDPAVVGKAEIDAAGHDIERVTVETEGDIMLIDPYTGDIVPAFGSAEVIKSQFIVDNLESKRLKEV